MAALGLLTTQAVLYMDAQNTNFSNTRGHSVALAIHAHCHNWTASADLLSDFVVTEFMLKTFFDSMAIAPFLQRVHCTSSSCRFSTSLYIRSPSIPWPNCIETSQPGIPNHPNCWCVWMAALGLSTTAQIVFYMDAQKKKIQQHAWPLCTCGHPCALSQLDSQRKSSISLSSHRIYAKKPSFVPWLLHPFCKAFIALAPAVSSQGSCT